MAANANPNQTTPAAKAEVKAPISVDAKAVKPLNVFVGGGTGNTGVAAIQHLLKTSNNVTITAGIRNAEKAKQLFPNADKRLTFVTLDVKGESLTGDKAKDGAILNGFDALIIVPPSALDNRSGLPIAYIDAAKAAGIKHIVAISAPAANKPNEVSLGKEFSVMENRARATGIPFTSLQAVFFFENQMMNAGSIKAAGAFYVPAKNSVPIPQISVRDIGEAAANVVLQGPTVHGNKTYQIAGDVRSWDDVAAVYTKLIAKTVKFYSATDAQAIEGMTKLGFPEFLAKSFVELNRDFERTGASYSNASLTQLLGRAPESFEQWLIPRVAAFKN